MITTIARIKYKYLLLLYYYFRNNYHLRLSTVTQCFYNNINANLKNANKGVISDKSYYTLNYHEIPSASK